MLQVGHAPASYSQGEKVRMVANYEGIGPMFKVILELTNESEKPITGTRIVLNIDETVYKVHGRYPILPLMLPGVDYRVCFNVENIEATGAPDVIQVYMFNGSSTMPLITANIQMPACEQEIDF